MTKNLTHTTPVDNAPSDYLNHLPAIYQNTAFIGQFLRAFQTLFDDMETLIGERLDYLKPEPLGDDPGQAPAEFLPWLAKWVVLTLREDWDEKTRRRFIRRVVPLYRLRGTKEGMTRLLQIYLGDASKPIIFDNRGRGNHPGFAYDPPAHFFQVQIRLNDSNPEVVWQKQRTIRAIIDQEKPAQTFYALQILLPAMHLVSQELAEETGDKRLVLGRNTLMGTIIPQ